MLLIDQNSHQLRHGKGGVRVVHLDRDLVGEQAPIRIAALEAADRVGKRTGDQEVLLQESKALAHELRIVGVKDAGQCLGRERLGEGLDEIAVRELLEVEVVRRRGGPQAESVDGGPTIADDRTVVGNADQSGWTPRYRAQTPARELERATEPDFDLLMRARDFPGIG